MSRTAAISVTIALCISTSSHPHGANVNTWHPYIERADSLIALQEFPEALQPAQQALEAARSELGPADTLIARILHRIGRCHAYSGELSKAKSAWLEELKILETSDCDQERQRGEVLANLAMAYMELDQYDSAHSCLAPSIDVYSTVYGPEHWRTVRLVRLRGGMYRRQGRYAEAEEDLHHALAVLQGTSAEQALQRAYAQNELGLLHEDVGRYTEADNAHSDALRTKLSALGSEHLAVANSHNNLGNLYRNMGRYAEAEEAHLEALRIRRRILETDHPDIALSLYNLGMVYWETGQYSKGLAALTESLRMHEARFGENHHTVALALNGLGLVYLEQGDLGKAEAAFTRAMDIQTAVHGRNHPSVAYPQDNLGLVFMRQHRYAEAMRAHVSALEIRRTSLSPEHPDIAKALENIGQVHYALGELDEAEDALEVARSGYESSLGSQHPYVANVLEVQAAIHYDKRELRSALEDIDLAFRIRQSDFVHTSSVLTERDALTYASRLRAAAHRFLSVYLTTPSLQAEWLQRSCDILFSSKGAVADEIFARRRTLAGESDPHIVAMADSLGVVRFLTSRRYAEGPTGSVQSYRREVDSLVRQADALETRLARVSASFRRRIRNRDVTVKALPSDLPESIVAIEYLRFGHYCTTFDTAIPHYAVAVIAHGQEPVLLDLGEAAPIDSAVTQYRKHLSAISGRGHPPLTQDRAAYGNLARRLYNLVLQPLEEHFAGTRGVFIAPDGMLNQVSFAALIARDGKYLIEKFPLHYLSAGRDLIRLQDTLPGQHGLLALGDPDYNAPASTRTGTHTAFSIAMVTESNLYRRRNTRSSCGTLHDMTWSALPSTRAEIESLQEYWRAHQPDSATVCTGPQASEEIFKRDAPGRRVIHLATHGYYLEGECNPEQPSYRLGPEPKFIGENPLLLSGLALAGANLHGEGSDTHGGEDGLLSAYEVAEMDLSGTDLVVLSACESGLGKIQHGEGVYGLRRAFQLAGARTVVSALWKVSDEATADMMAELYSDSEEPLYERMRKMQLAQLSRLRASADQTEHPSLWAAFIAMGDWR